MILFPFSASDSTSSKPIEEKSNFLDFLAKQAPAPEPPQVVIPKRASTNLKVIQGDITGHKVRLRDFSKRFINIFC